MASPSHARPHSSSAWPRCQTVLIVAALLAVLLYLGGPAWRWAHPPPPPAASLARALRMVQLQLEAIDRKIDAEVGAARGDLLALLEEKRLALDGSGGGVAQPRDLRPGLPAPIFFFLCIIFIQDLWSIAAQRKKPKPNAPEEQPPPPRVPMPIPLASRPAAPRKRIRNHRPHPASPTPVLSSSAAAATAAAPHARLELPHSSALSPWDATKNTARLVMLLYLGDLAWRWAYPPPPPARAALDGYAARAAEVEASLARALRMVQLQLEAVDHKIDAEVGAARGDLLALLEEKRLALDRSGGGVAQPLDLLPGLPRLIFFFFFFMFKQLLGPKSSALMPNAPEEQPPQLQTASSLCPPAMASPSLAESQTAGVSRQEVAGVVKKGNADKEPAALERPEISGRDVAAAAILEEADVRVGAGLATKSGQLQQQAVEVSARCHERRGAEPSSSVVESQTAAGASRQEVAGVVKKVNADEEMVGGGSTEGGRLRVERTKAVVVEAAMETTGAVVQVAAESTSRRIEYLTSPLPNRLVKRTITSWTKGEYIGRGSFGTVYEAMGDGGFLFAVKEVLLLDQGPNAKQKLEDEISLLSRLEHENIVQYLGTDKEDGKLYIFLELVIPGSLATLYQKYRLEDSQVSAYTRQILNGLNYLHQQNVLHRDIKCANILVDACGLVKLADFGLAKEMSMSQAKSCKGTFYWMAPEVARSKPHGPPADIWSLGCTVLEMLTGKVPYPGMEEQHAFFEKVGKGIPPEIPNTLSEDARDFIKRCVQANPNDRPSAAQLLEHPFVQRPLQH